MRAERAERVPSSGCEGQEHSDRFYVILHSFFVVRNSRGPSTTYVSLLVHMVVVLRDMSIL